MSKQKLLVRIVLVLGTIGLSIWLVLSWMRPAAFFPTPELLNAVDKDSNGIWDDLDVYLQSQAIRSKNLTDLERQAVIFYIQSFQKVLLNPELAVTVRNEKDQDDIFGRGFDCMIRVLDPEDFDEFEGDLKNQILSSKERMRAWLRYSQNLSGAVLEIWDERTRGHPCPFIGSD